MSLPLNHGPVMQNDLFQMMARVSCAGGRTQLVRTLNHACQETRQHRINALVLIGDSVEEKVDLLCDFAGQLGVLNTPIFVFHEGHDALAGRVFQDLARLSRGAYSRFDLTSAQQLRDLFGCCIGLCRRWFSGT